MEGTPKHMSRFTPTGRSSFLKVRLLGARQPGEVRSLLLQIHACVGWLTRSLTVLAAVSWYQRCQVLLKVASLVVVLV